MADNPLRKPGPAWAWFLLGGVGLLAAVAGAAVGNYFSVLLGIAWVALGTVRGLAARKAEALRNG